MHTRWKPGTSNRMSAAARANLSRRPARNHAPNHHSSLTNDGFTTLLSMHSFHHSGAEFVSRWMEWCCAGPNATSPTTDGLGEDEPRGWDYFSGASEQRGVVLLATSRLLTIKSDRHAVCGRKAVVFDRWSNHLLVKIIILLPYPCYHLLVEYASCSSSI